MILRNSCTIRCGAQTALPACQLAQILYAFSWVRARVSHGPAQEKRKAMQLSTRTQTKARKSRLHWMATLSASVASFVAGARSQPQPDLVTTKHSRVFSQRGVAPWAPPGFGMLVEGEVGSKSFGMIP